jgi:5-methylcytosine-specific restriction endonuclease McrA
MTHIPDAVRRDIINRASGCSEYCLIAQQDMIVSHEIDHILAEKHGGETLIDNLCLSCMNCNRHKGTDFGSVDRETKEIV